VQPGERVAVLAYNSYAECDIAAAENLVPLPPALAKAPVPGEALGCAMNVFARSGIEAGQRVAIVGVGFLGAVLTQLAVRRGAEVLAISRRPFALEMAAQFGAAVTMSMVDPKAVLAAARERTGGAGYDCVIEAVGQQPALDLATELTRERGRLVIAGYHQDGPRQVNMQLWNWRGLDVINAHERDAKVYVAGMRAAVQAMAAGQLDPRPLFTHAFPLDQVGEALQAMRVRPARFMKALVIL
jgi:threonine dehydrogenase-like Zn-dependent dehydrogenase